MLLVLWYSFTSRSAVWTVRSMEVCSMRLCDMRIGSCCESDLWHFLPQNASADGNSGLLSLFQSFLNSELPLCPGVHSLLTPSVSLGTFSWSHAIFSRRSSHLGSPQTNQSVWYMGVETVTTQHEHLMQITIMLSSSTERIAKWLNVSLWHTESISSPADTPEGKVVTFRTRTGYSTGGSQAVR
jgi:hypothetical protein